MIVAGGGVAGLGTALALARSGCEVTVLDRDQLDPALTPDLAFSAERRGAPQVRHTHGLLARLTSTLRQHFPDVLDDLLSAGGIEVDLAHRFSAPEEGDEQLRVLLARRTTLEWALRRGVASQAGVTLASGVAAKALIADGTRIRGVEFDSGGTLEADMVVAAGGRRLGVPEWLSAVGVSLPEEEHDTGIVYLTRWYRTPAEWDGVMAGEELVKLGGDLGYLFYLAVPADRGTFSLTMAIGARDESLRGQLLKEDAFDRAAAALPLPPGLVAGLVPDGPVHPMGGLVNRIRRFVDAAGDPLVTGFYAVGDAHTCTNPIYGRGCSLALVQAVSLAAAVTAHPDDLQSRAQAYEAAAKEQVEPWYHLSVETDAARRAAAAAQADAFQVGGGTAPRTDLLGRLIEMAGDDPLVGRAIVRAINLLATPQQLMSDPALMTRVMELAAAHDQTKETANAWARTGPTRKEMLDLTVAA